MIPNLQYPMSARSHESQGFPWTGQHVQHPPPPSNLNNQVFFPQHPSINQIYPYRDNNHRYDIPQQNIDHRIPQQNIDHRYDLPQQNIDHRIPQQNIDHRYDLPQQSIDHRIPQQNIDHRYDLPQQNIDHRYDIPQHNTSSYNISHSSIMSTPNSHFMTPSQNNNLYQNLLSLNHHSNASFIDQSLENTHMTIPGHTISNALSIQSHQSENKNNLKSTQDETVPSPIVSTDAQDQITSHHTKSSILTSPLLSTSRPSTSRPRHDSHDGGNLLKPQRRKSLGSCRPTPMPEQLQAHFDSLYNDHKEREVRKAARREPSRKSVTPLTPQEYEERCVAWDERYSAIMTARKEKAKMMQIRRREEENAYINMECI
eukprot:GHVL01009901.1.p1 GENE.GHVL01009901.1~~GHVL01009901.1.p1  ORF type:complete len:371 (+),score=60.95 GHVL01009901.1:94-1206(+)